MDAHGLLVKIIDSLPYWANWCLIKIITKGGMSFYI